MGIEAIKVNKNQISNVINTMLQAREKHQGIFQNPPEEQYIKLNKIHGEKIEDQSYSLRNIFYTTSMVYGDDTELLFKRISDPHLIKEYDWIFSPRKVINSSESKVRDACLEFFRPGGYNNHAIEQWCHNSFILETLYGGKLENYFEKYHNNATEIIDALVVKPRAKTHDKPEFRRFGPKLSRLLVQWVNQYKLYELNDTDKNGIPVDFQVGRIFIQTNGISLSEPTKTHDVGFKTLLPLLTDLINTENLNSRLISESIYLIGNRCCNKKRHDLCPLENMCTSLISRDFYDKGGVFDPQDVGRFKL
jgi:hypothetical protein